MKKCRLVSAGGQILRVPEPPVAAVGRREEGGVRPHAGYGRAGFPGEVGQLLFAEQRSSA